VRRKLNAMALEFVDKVVLLVDGILCSFLQSVCYLIFSSQTLLFGEQHPRKLYKWLKTLVQRKLSLQAALPPFGMHHYF
jgi:hypothetical protein